ncbi:MAG: hypothetical protein MHM6MM_006318, partial [Cercozoa sp. M6MM]
ARRPVALVRRLVARLRRVRHRASARVRRRVLRPRAALRRATPRCPPSRASLTRPRTGRSRPLRPSCANWTEVRDVTHFTPSVASSRFSCSNSRSACRCLNYIITLR